MIATDTAVTDDELIEHFQDAVDFYLGHEDVEDTWDAFADNCPLEPEHNTRQEWAASWNGKGPVMVAAFSDGRVVWWNRKDRDGIYVKRESVN